MEKEKIKDVLETKKVHQAVAVNEPEAKAVALAPDAENDSGFSLQDIQVATLLLMQPSSDMVSGQKAKLGDIVNNESEQVVGGIDKPLEVIGLFKNETIRIYAAADGKFIKELPSFTGNRPEFLGEENGIPIKRYQTINFFVLLTADIKSGEGFPVLIRFKSSSFNAGKKFASMLARKIQFKKNAYDFAVSIGVERRQNEKKQNWAAFTFSEGRSTTAEERAIAQPMKDLIAASIRAKKVVIIDGEDAAEPSSEYEKFTGQF